MGKARDTLIDSLAGTNRIYGVELLSTVAAVAALEDKKEGKRVIKFLGNNAAAVRLSNASPRAPLAIALTELLANTGPHSGYLLDRVSDFCGEHRGCAKRGQEIAIRARSEMRVSFFPAGVAVPPDSPAARNGAWRAGITSTGRLSAGGKFTSHKKSRHVQWLAAA